MRIPIDDLEVIFPYPYVYKEQLDYMRHLKQALDAKGHCLLEMPSGTGKTISLLALITSYIHRKPLVVRKLIYCSRTVPELEKVMEELRNLLRYRENELKEDCGKFTCIALSSRKNMCIHETVKDLPNRAKVDAACHDLTSPWIREQAKINSNIETCQYYEGFDREGREAVLAPGVYSLDNLSHFGKTKTWCPYFAARHFIGQANIVVYAYPYLLDPKIARLVSGEMERDTVVVFDEAHNIDNACIESMSIRLTKPTMQAATQNLVKLNTAVGHAKQRGGEKLQEEYQRLRDGLRRTNGENAIDQLGAANDVSLVPVLDESQLEKGVPGNIRKAEHFLAFMKRFVEYLKARMMGETTVVDPTLAFRYNLYKDTFIEPQPLKFCSERLGSLLRTLETQHIDEFTPLMMVAEFATLVGTFSEGFSVIMEPLDDRTGQRRPILQLRCLDAKIAIDPIFKRFQSVIITSGTLSPLDMYPKILGFQASVSQSLPMTLSRNCVAPMIVTRGSDQVPISTKFDMREDPGVVRNFGVLLTEMAAVVPDGIVCFFTSYSYLERTVGAWHDTGVINDVLAHKLVFIETQDAMETSLALENYKRACDCGRGGVLLSVARGKVSEGIDFNHHYGRCVIMFGIPYVHTESRTLRARLEYLREKYQIREGDFLTFDAMRTAAQCLGRVIRTKSDYGIMILADKRYTRSDKRSKLPKWILQFLNDKYLGLSTDMAVSCARSFLKEMGQPHKREDQLGGSLLSQEYFDSEQRLAKRSRVTVSRAPPPPEGSAEEIINMDVD